MQCELNVLGVSLGTIKPVITCHLSKDHHSLIPDISVRNQGTIFKAHVVGISPTSIPKSCVFTDRHGMYL